LKVFGEKRSSYPPHPAVKVFEKWFDFEQFFWDYSFNQMNSFGMKTVWTAFNYK
jgi:hypothetical protein